MSEQPVVGVIMGSDSDWETLRHAVDTLREHGVPCEWHVVSAHRTPDRMVAYAKAAESLVLLQVYQHNYQSKDNGDQTSCSICCKNDSVYISMVFGARK